VVAQAASVRREAETARANVIFMVGGPLDHGAVRAVP